MNGAGLSKSCMASVPTSDPPEVFVDSSGLIAASLSSRGYARDLLVAGQQGKLRLSLSTLVLRETERNILNKAPAAWGDFKLLTQALAARPPLVLP